MTILALDHIQLAMPPGREDEARAFYSGLLGLSERRKPDNLIGRGGCWFEQGDIRIHLGVEEDFRPARKAHPGLLVDDLAGLVEVLGAAGFAASGDQPLAGYERRYVTDPFGNRIELMEAVPSA